MFRNEVFHGWIAGSISGSRRIAEIVSH